MQRKGEKLLGSIALFRSRLIITNELPEMSLIFAGEAASAKLIDRSWQCLTGEADITRGANPVKWNGNEGKKLLKKFTSQLDRAEFLTSG